MVTLAGGEGNIHLSMVRFWCVKEGKQRNNFKQKTASQITENATDLLLQSFFPDQHGC